jgi:hypothetical protein
MNNHTQVIQFYHHSPQLCGVCKESNTKEEFVSMCHKWREYRGYSSGALPRYTCSKECLDYYEKNYKCNQCKIVTYDWNQYIKASDGFTYCDNEHEITVGDKPCYYIKFDLPYWDNE